MTNIELIEKAKSIVNFKQLGNSTSGSVACALVSENGNIYTGVCIDTSSGMGFCAEHTAISQMITKGEYSVVKIVAVKIDENGNANVLSPCGRCREFMKQTNLKNLETDVILDIEKTIKLKELLPFHDWEKHI